jgi:hypothetical protein
MRRGKATNIRILERVNRTKRDFKGPTDSSTILDEELERVGIPRSGLCNKMVLSFPASERNRSTNPDMIASGSLGEVRLMYDSFVCSTVLDVMG